jgi:hypothetical protein
VRDLGKMFEYFNQQRMYAICHGNYWLFDEEEAVLNQDKYSCCFG